MWRRFSRRWAAETLGRRRSRGSGLTRQRIGNLLALKLWAYRRRPRDRVCRVADGDFVTDGWLPGWRVPIHRRLGLGTTMILAAIGTTETMAIRVVVSSVVAESGQEVAIVDAIKRRAVGSISELGNRLQAVRQL